MRDAGHTRTKVASREIHKVSSHLRAQNSNYFVYRPQPVECLYRLLEAMTAENAKGWCARRDSNSRPVAPEATALSS